MAQKTAKTVLEVLEWIETTPHHIGRVIDTDRRELSHRDDAVWGLELVGYGDKLRIPQLVWRATTDLVRSGGFFDRRMYRANRKGNRLLHHHRKEHPRG